MTHFALDALKRAGDERAQATRQAIEEGLRNPEGGKAALSPLKVRRTSETITFIAVTNSPENPPPDEAETLGAEASWVDRGPLSAPEEPEATLLRTGVGSTPSSGDRPQPAAGDGNRGGNSLAEGRMLGNRYRILEILGSGGMGEVWRAYDLKLRMDVALKSLRTGLGEGEELLEILRREVRAAREVISPNVCRLFDLIEVQGEELVSMEYIDGQTLLELLKERGPLDLEEAREIGAQFLAGLEAIHQADLVHRDIKPENIMLTRSGRVVIMDFGLTSPTGQGEFGGTPAYMAPEQGRGEATDARADVFAAGMVLAEMLSAERGPDTSSRLTFWENVRKDPPEIPATPWTRLLTRAVAVDREDRYASAAELARRLEEITVRVEGAERKTPYPGLASFTEDSAEFFFGREAEVEAVWKKLRHAYLLGLVGASGSGKSSFVNAGLLPARPDGWGSVRVKPGRAPFDALGRALQPELEDDDSAVEGLSALDDPESGGLSALERWRARHQHALLIVDQFEELFTLNSTGIQAKFAALLSRAALEGDVHVLISMRDDFLLRCHDFEALDPLFSELTPLKPPVGSALRRALTQPALRLGYRFEDDGMVEEMLDAVTKERGALPLIAFTAARLWEERDPEEGLLTREAYDRIGGVGGALATHAEANLEQIGKARMPIVRELFRNLVTAQGTRAVPEINELLSLFAPASGGEQETVESQSAEEVLQALIDARLLTSYEVPGPDSEAPQQRVEVVHESLLDAWPRLVRWRTQDAEGAQLRDELRQAAKLWEARRRSEDLLWTGTAYREFEIWRERYPGRLTALEEEYAGAMVALAGRTRRRRRLAVAAALTIALAVAVVTSTLWGRSEVARREAVASELLALARMEEESFPTGSLAYATRSLELADSVTARRFVLETLWGAPPVRTLRLEGKDLLHLSVEASPDGEWLVTADLRTGETYLYPRDAPAPRLLWTPPGGESLIPAFSPDGDVLVLRAPWVAEVWILSVPEGEVIATLRPGASMPEEEWSQPWAEVRGDQVFTFAWSEQLGVTLVESWPLADGEPTLLGIWKGVACAPHTAWAWDLDPTGTWLACTGPGTGTVYRLQLDELENAREQELATHGEVIETIAFAPSGDRLALTDRSGQVLVWSLDGAFAEPLLTVEGALQDGSFKPRFDSSGSWLTWGSQAQRAVFLVDVDGPPDLLPTKLRLPDVMIRNGTFDPRGEWLATVHDNYIAFWSLEASWSQSLPPTSLVMWGPLTVTADAQYLASAHFEGLRVWPLAPHEGRGRKVDGFRHTRFVAAHPNRPEVLASKESKGPLVLVSLEGGWERQLLERHPTGTTSFGALAFDTDGRRAAMGTQNAAGDEQNAVRIWNLEADDVRVLPADAAGTESLAFLPGDRLLSAGLGGARLWDLEEGKSTVFLEAEKAQVDVSPDRRHALVVHGDVIDQYLRNSRLSWFDLETGERREVTTHGGDVQYVSFDPSGQIVVSTDAEGVTRVGPVTGEEPQLLLGIPAGGATQPTVTPDGRWIFSGGGSEIRRWPMPRLEDLRRQPLHLLPREELLARLRSLTNLRVVADEDAPTGYAWSWQPLSEWAAEDSR